jgi:predicted P-loop ATPase/GTPase
MTLLVVGGDRVDAGKTTFAAGLTAFLGTTAFKPRAGNDYWFDHDDARHALAGNRLYGKDAARLAEASAGELTPEELNPLHRLWRPAPRPGTGLLGNSDREFVIDRVGETYVYNGTVELPSLVREELPVEQALAVSSIAEFNEVMETHHLSALDRVTARIERTTQPVVESYGDVARPLRNVEPAAVACVEPRRARIYRGDRYAKACSVASGGSREGQLETRVESVSELIEPVASATLDPLPSARREDPRSIASADAYAEAYEALIGTARG